MKRRDVLAGLGLGGLAVGHALAQAPPRPPRVAFFTRATTETRPAFVAFQARLRQRGWIDGQTMALRFYLAGGAGLDRVDAMAREVVAGGYALVVTDGNVPTRALARASSTVPIAAMIGFDPTDVGLAAALGRPAGNVTGLTLFSETLNLKRIEVLREMAPGIRRVAFVVSTSSLPNQSALDAAGRALGLALYPTLVESAADAARILTPAAFEAVDGIMFAAHSALDAAPQSVVALVNAARKPAVYPDRAYVAAGGVASYGVSMNGAFELLADQVDRLLRGAKPGDTPFMRPDRFEMIVNLAAARAQALPIPATLIARANEVIE